MRRQVAGFVVAIAAAVLLTGLPAEAEPPAAGTISPAATSATWQGGPFTVPNPSGVCPLAVTPGCDTYQLTVAPPTTGDYTVAISTTPSSPDDDYDLYVYDANGTEVGSSTSASGSEKVVLDSPHGGTYSVQVVAYMISPGDTYTGNATLTVGAPPAANDPASTQ